MDDARCIETDENRRGAALRAHPPLGSRCKFQPRARMTTSRAGGTIDGCLPLMMERHWPTSMDGTASIRCRSDGQ